LIGALADSGPFGNALAYIVGYSAYGLGALMDTAGQLVPVPDGGNDGASRTVVVIRSIFQFVARWLGADFPQLDLALDYLSNSALHNQIPDPPSAVSAYLADAIKEDLLYCWTRAGRWCDTTTDNAVQTQQQKVVPVDANTLYRQARLTKEDWRKKLRAQGWIEESWQDEQLQASERWPALPDLMARADTGLYAPGRRERLGLDDDSEWQNDPIIQGRIKALGLADGEAKDAWAAHWRPIDPQTAIELYRRGQAGQLPQGETFDLGDVSVALEQAGLPPGQRGAWLALLTTPLNRRQVGMLYNYNAIDQAGVLQALLASGYSQQDATAQLTQLTIAKAEFLRKRIGAPGASGFVGLFASGELGTSELLAELQALGFTDDEAQQALTEARAQRQRKTRGELTRYLKGRYLKGEATDAGVQAVLIDAGLDNEDVADLLRLWRTEREVSPKNISASEMLDWHCKGLLSDADLAERLADLNYGADDIARMVAAAEMRCWTAKMGQVDKLLSPAKAKIKTAEAYWSRILGRLESRVGTVKQRTKTRAGQLLAIIKHDLEGAPPPAKSLTGRAQAILAQGATNGSGQSGTPVSTGGTGTATGTASGGGGAPGGATMAAAAAPPTLTAAVIAPAGAAQPGPSEAETQSPPTGSETTSGTSQG
jgi:hypothetical protein